MLPSGGATTLVFQPITWSPENRISVPSSAKHRWSGACPGVCTAVKAQPSPASRLAVGKREHRATKSWSTNSLPEGLVRLVPARWRAAAEAGRLGAGGCKQRRHAVGVVAVRVGDERRG